MQCFALYRTKSMKGAHLIIDAPDHIKIAPNERLINQAIRAYGVQS